MDSWLFTCRWGLGNHICVQSRTHLETKSDTEHFPAESDLLVCPELPSAMISEVLERVLSRIMDGRWGRACHSLETDLSSFLSHEGHYNVFIFCWLKPVWGLWFQSHACHTQPVFLSELCSWGQARCSSAAVRRVERSAVTGRIVPSRSERGSTSGWGAVGANAGKASLRGEKGREGSLPSLLNWDGSVLSPRGQPGGLNTKKEREASILTSKHSNKIPFVKYTRQRQDREPLFCVGLRCGGQGAHQPRRWIPSVCTDVWPPSIADGNAGASSCLQAVSPLLN